MRRSAVTLVLLAASVVQLSAQTNAATMAARRWRQHHERAVVEEFLALPNVTNDRAGIARNAAALGEMMRRRGLEPQLLSVDGSNPVVFGQIRTPQATRTIVFYAHYDGQPVTPSDWTSPPFTPVLRTRSLDEGGQPAALPSTGTPLDPETRIYARSASDDKASIVAMMAALDAITAAGLRPRSDVRFVFDGEEEAGSTNLERVLGANRALFAGDVWLICDGTRYPGNLPLVTFGARGFMSADITVYGARRDLHSGNFGNWAPNPALALARLLASMKDDNGRVLIRDFYAGVEPLTAIEQQALRDVPPTEGELMKELWLGSTEGSPETLNERLAQPSLNVRGLSSGRVGRGATTVIPARADASIDMRLVKGMDYRQTFLRLADHVRQQGFFVTETEPTANVLRSHPRVARFVPGLGTNAVRTPMDLPIARDVVRALSRARNGGQAVDDGREPAARGHRPDVRHARHQHPPVQPGQQQPQRQRESAAAEPVGRDRNDGDAASDVKAGADAGSFRICGVQGTPMTHHNLMEANND